MSQPDYVPLYLGDTADDDAQVIDSLVQSEADPPAPVIEPVDIPVLPEPIIPTRLLSVNQIISPSWTPVLLFPADTRRTRLVIKVTALGADPVETDGIVIRSDYGDPWGLAVLTHEHKLELDGHTGAVFVQARSTDSTNANANVNPVSVDAWCVTK